jgi:hypothetical protein
VYVETFLSSKPRTIVVWFISVHLLSPISTRRTFGSMLCVVGTEDSGTAVVDELESGVSTRWLTGSPKPES